MRGCNVNSHSVMLVWGESVRPLEGRAVTEQIKIINENKNAKPGQRGQRTADKTDLSLFFKRLKSSLKLR